MDYIGGFITKNPTVPTTTAAPGVWKLSQAVQYIKAGTWPTPPIGDPYFQYTNLLLGTGSTNGAQNNTFLDSSSNNFTITRNGNTTQGSFTPFSQADGYWGNYFDGTGDYLSGTMSSDLAFGTSDMSMQCWVYPTTLGSNNTIFDTRQGGTSFGNDSFTLVVVSGIVSVAAGSYSTSVYVIESPSSISANTWTHIAFSRVSGTNYLFVNGVQVASNSNSWNQTYTAGRSFYIGQTIGFSREFAGYISNLKAVNGTGFTSVTVPTTPLTATTNTKLLTCQSNRFVDNSTNAYALTPSGNTAVIPFQPFGAPTSPYNTPNVGGSGFFDGSGDYLTATLTNNAPGTGDFTYEAWYYATSMSATMHMMQTRSGDTSDGFQALVETDGTIRVGYSGQNFINSSSGAFKQNQWNHFAVVRSSGTITAYLNGVSIGSASKSDNFTSTTFKLAVAANANVEPFNGYISNFRYVKGTAVYTTGFTPPTAPVTAITNTALLLNFTNAAIFDNAAKNDMETVGNAQVSTSVTKFGNSMSFDGTGDYLVAKAQPTYKLGTGDFTIECWAYWNTVGTQVIVGNITNGGGDDWAFYYIAGGTDELRFIANGAAVILGAKFVPSTSTWYHLAVSKTSGVYKFFVNGNQIGSTANTTSITFAGSNLYVGSSNGNTLNFNGYISNLRITTGLGRYTYAFTAPTQAFGTIYQAPTTPAADPYFDYTTLLLPGTGTNGAQNNTFLDSSTNNFTVTRNGNTTQGTFSPFSQANGYWSNYFDGTGDYLDFPDNAAFRPGTGDFTIEGWFYSTSSSNTSTIKLLGTTTGYQTGGFAILRSAFGADGNFDFIIEPSDVAANVIRLGTFGSSLLNNTWYHFAVARSGTTLSAWVNGVRTDTDTNSTNIDDSGGDALRIGGNRENTSNLWQGYISNIKYNKGTAYYDPTQTTITVPTSPLTNTSGTDLLTCQSNRFVDNSSNAFAATPAGDISVQQFVPFNPTAAYSAGTNGGSGYFDGTGDYLSVAGATALNYGSGDFTIECWYYPTSTSNGEISAQGDGALPGSTYEIKFRNAGYLTINMYSTAGGVTVSFNTSKNWVLNAWNHVAVVRNGNTVTCYMDGVSAGTGDATGASFGVTDNVYVGAGLAGGNVYKGGYIANFRIVKGTAVYTTGFTPPTAPLTAISGTSLLANFTNAGITDATAKNDLETVGNAQISNGQAKWGSTSMYFDGTGDYLLAPNSENFNFGIGDFTIEYWIYFSSASGTVGIFTKRATTSDYAPVLHYLTSGNWAVKFSTGGTTWDAEIITSITPSTSTWYHVAITKYGTSTKLFVNGQELGSTTVSGSLMTNTASISIGSYAANGNSPLTGYIQDFRITKGIARYTQNFTPPTAAFQLL